MIAKRQLAPIFYAFILWLPLLNACSNLGNTSQSLQSDYVMLLQNKWGMYLLENKTLVPINFQNIPKGTVVDLIGDKALFQSVTSYYIYDFEKKEAHPIPPQIPYDAKCIFMNSNIIWYADEHIWEYDRSNDRIFELAKVSPISPEYGTISYDRNNGRIFYCDTDYNILYYDIHLGAEGSIGIKGMEPEISPDGSLIKFIHPKKLRLTIFNMKTHRSKTFGPKLHISSAWTPDSNGVVYEDTARGISYAVHNGIMNSLWTEYSVRPQMLKRFDVTTHAVEKIGETPDSFYRFMFAPKSLLP